MNIKKIIIAFVLGMVLLVPSGVGAVDLGADKVRDAGVGAGFDEASDTTLAEIIGRVINIALSLIGILFTVLILYAGFLWMTARGEEARVTKAKDIIRAGIIGLVITLGAYSISAFVVPRVLESTTQPEVGGPPSTP